MQITVDTKGEVFVLIFVLVLGLIFLLIENGVL
jgi:hypothetical protein